MSTPYPLTCADNHSTLMTLLPAIAAVTSKTAFGFETIRLKTTMSVIVAYTLEDVTVMVVPGDRTAKHKPRSPSLFHGMKFNIRPLASLQLGHCMGT